MKPIGIWENADSYDPRPPRSVKKAKELSIKKWEMIYAGLKAIGASMVTDCGFCALGWGCDDCPAHPECEFAHEIMVDMSGIEIRVHGLIGQLKKVGKK